MTFPPSARVASALLIFTLAAATHAQEWARFRGPNGSGLGKAPGFPAQFSKKDFNWETELPGSGHSSPIVAGGKVFVTCNPANTGQRVLVAVDAASGKIAWQRAYETKEFRKHADNSYASSTPAADAERVYVCWMSPDGSGLAALDQKDGKELWRKELGSFVAQHGPAASPIVAGGMVLLEFDQDEPKSFLAAFDAKTGAEKWRWEHAGTSHSSSTPCLFQPKTGGPQVITTSRTLGMTAVDLQTGKVAWQLPDLLPKRCVSSPIVTEGGLVIAQCGEGQAESFVYAVKPADDGKSAKSIYEVRRTGGYVPTPIAVGELLFLWKENGLVTCLRAATNEQVWSERVQGPFYGSPVCVEGRLYNTTRKGDLVVLNASDKFQELTRVALGEGSFATPAISGGRMYLRTFTRLISVGK